MRSKTASALAATLLLSCSASAAPTFTRDVAPIVYSECAACHQPGGAAPFDLLTYPDVMKRGEQIVLVTESRFMPPWLPLPGYGEFLGERSLTEKQLETIRSWVEGGMVEGDPGDLPSPPDLNQGWQLGPPDAVASSPEPYALPADGVDVIRNFVIPSPVTETRFIESVELLPGNKRVVHHAVLKLDRTRATRQIDARDAEPGFPGMRMGNGSVPDGHIIVWTPGATPAPPFEGMAWRLEPGDDLILQLHMVPVGKPETIAPRIGLHFADREPTIFPFDVMLRDDRIDIPAGAKNHVVEDSMVLPVPVVALGIYPHAHYLGKRMEVKATWPDGREEWLMRIDDWDFNWQGMYRYVEPRTLPKGTELSMRFTYDNSTDNVRNPNDPPLRVVSGNRSSDEMANLVLQVVPENPDDLTVLREAQWRKMLADDPDDPAAHFNLAVEYARQERLEDAVRHYEQVIRVDPTDEAAHFGLAGVHYRRGDLRSAAERYESVLRIDPKNARAHFVLGWILAGKDDLSSAVEHYREALRIDPQLAAAGRELQRVLRQLEGEPANGP